MARILNFTVIDYETANSKRWSICAVGVAVVKSGEIVDKWSQLIDPQIADSEWGSMNIKISGIRPVDVRGKPTFKGIYPKIKRSVARGRVVSHSPFDRTATRQACERYGLPMLQNPWRDSRVLAAEKAWPKMPSHSLPKIAPKLGIRYVFHDAGEDARAAAELVLLAAAKIGTEGVNAWLNGR